MDTVLEKVRFYFGLKNEQVSDRGHGKERLSGQKLYIQRLQVQRVKTQRAFRGFGCVCSERWSRFVVHGQILEDESGEYQ